MKNAALCFCSFLIGACLVIWLQRGPSPTSAAAAPPSKLESTLKSKEQGIATQGQGVSFRAPANETLLDDALSDRIAPRVYDASGMAPDEAVSAFVYEANNRSVTNIATRLGAARGLFGENPTSDSGSGFIIDREGHILTNNHVIESAQRILVTLYDGQEYEGKLVGADPINDMAVVKIDAAPEALVPVRFTDSSNLKVGMKVFAIGNPFGLERTMTTGIISSLDRTLPVTQARSIKSVIQIDAAINPGNSGGPLLNSHGEVIGINTAIASKTGQNSGIGFAIPANLLARVVPELIEHGRFIRPEFGIEDGVGVDDIDADGSRLED